MSDALTFTNEAPSPGISELPFAQYNTTALASVATTTLLHFDDGNGSTAFTDSGTSPSTWSAVNTSGTAAESTAQAEFGTGSLFINGNACCIATPQTAGSALDLTAQANFTVECFVYPTSTTQTQASGSGDVVICDLTGDSNTLFEIQMLSNLKVTVQGFGANGWSGLGQLSAAMNLNTWNHIALVRNGNSVLLGVNGVLTSGVVTGNAAALTGTPHARIGMDVNSGVQHTAWNGGYIDEFSVTLSSKYSGSTYVVPTAPVVPSAPNIPANIIAGACMNVLLGNGNAAGLTLPTAAQVYQTISDLVPKPGKVQFRFRFINNGTSTIGLTAPAGVTVNGSTSIAPATWREYDVTITGPTTCTFNSVGGGTYS